jgi:hypothetical protein
MTTRKPREVLSGLIDWSENASQDEAGLDEELAAAGVDVPAFLAKVRTRMAIVAEASRLSWRDEAQRKMAARKTVPSGKYSKLGHDALLAELTRRQAAGVAQAWFHKFEELTDDDLRTLLEDQDALDEE